CEPEQVGPQRVSLDVAGRRVQVVVFLDQKRLEAPLVEMPRANRLAKGMPALGVGQRQPTDELRKFAILLWPKDQVPVIRHQHEQIRIGERSTTSARISSNSAKSASFWNSRIRPAPRLSAIEHVKHHSSGSDPR